VYGTSVGALLGLFVVLRYDFSIIADFFIKRPWHKVISFEFEDVVQMIQNNGYMDTFFIEDIMTRLITAMDLSEDITLQELYDLTHIHFFIYSTKVNTFEPIVFCHDSYPSLSVKTAVMMSCALPPIFKPILYNGEYYMDGGIFCNYAINHCLERYPNKEETLGLHVTTGSNNSKQFTDLTSMPEYILMCVNKLVKKNQKQNYIPNVNEIYIKVKYQALDAGVWKSFLDENKRKEMYDYGITISDAYIKERNSKTPQESQCSV